MPSVAYVRQYKIAAGKAQVQDFYYPSMKKYSDPYEIPAGQIKVFVPALDNGTLTLWHFNGQKKMVGSYRNGKPHGEWINWYPNGKKICGHALSKRLERGHRLSLLPQRRQRKRNPIQAR